MTARVLRESFHQNGRPAQVVVHQRNRRAVNRHFAAAAPSRCQCRPPRAPARRHTVADHCHAIALRLHAAHKLNLVLRQTFAPGLFAANFSGHTGRHRLPVAGNHRDAANPRFLQLGERIPSLRRGSGLASQPTRCTWPSARDKKSNSSLGLVEVNSNSQNPRSRRVLEPLRPANHYFGAAHFSLHAASRLVSANSAVRPGAHRLRRNLREPPGSREWLLYFSADARPATIPPVWFRQWAEPADGELAVVSVPVLSKTKALILAALDVATFLIKMPSRARRTARRPSRCAAWPG